MGIESGHLLKRVLALYFPWRFFLEVRSLRGTPSPKLHRLVRTIVQSTGMVLA